MTNIDQEYENLQLEKMRYNNNSISYKLGLGGIVLSLVAMFIGLNSVAPSSILTLFIVLINILVFLFGFLSSEKVKTYSKKYSFYMYGLGGICVARIFVYPLILIVNYSKFMAMMNGATPENFANTFDSAKAQYKDTLGATIMGTLNSDSTAIIGTGYLWNNGIFRGILLMIILVCAAACFISAGIIGYTKQKKLNAYLDSIKK